MTPLEIALELADRGIPVFPCTNSKKPAIPRDQGRGFHDASIDPFEIRRMFAFAGAALVGVPTGAASGIAVLDLDPRNGSDAWTDAVRLPATLTHATRSGGRHFFFQAPPGLRSSNSRVAPGVDIKAEGGYVIYWPNCGGSVLDSSPIAPMPDWVLPGAPTVPTATAATPGRLHPAPSTYAVVDLLNRLPNPLPNGRDVWVQVMHAAAACGHQDGLDAEAIADAACRWAARWPGSMGYDVERDKYDSDFVHRDNGKAGWPHLLARGCREIPGFGAEIAAAEFATSPLPHFTNTADTFNTGNHVFQLTQDGVALAFVHRHREELRFCHELGSWYRWSSGVWKRDATQLAFEWGRLLSRELGSRPETPPAVRERFATVRHADAVEKFARTDRDLVIEMDQFDADNLLMGTPNGTVNLRTGRLMEARSEDYISRCAGATPDASAECPTWLRFLAEATAGDDDLVRFLQQWCGYCLTGETREHALLFIYGPGGNGKSVFLNTLVGVLGNYAVTAPMDMLTPGKGERHPTEIAMLRGARLVSASETDEGKPWDEAKIKTMTGGDRITARFMRQDYFSFDPRFKLVVVGNHKPGLRNPDAAARRRFNIVPFVHQPTEPDRGLEAKLRTEAPGILRWMIEGCLAWQKTGLVRPQVVAAATAEYFSEQDHVARWIEECCEVGDHNLEATSEELFRSWSAYAVKVGERPQTFKWLAPALERLGCTPERRVGGRAAGKRGYLKIAIRSAANGPLQTADLS